MCAVWAGFTVLIFAIWLNFSFFRYLVDDCTAAVLQHVEYEFETVRTLVIWVRDMAPIGKLGHEIAHAEQFVEIPALGSKAAHTFVIVVVHNDYHVEIVEIAFAHRPRTVLQIIAASRCRTTHTGVGQFAGMSRIGAGRIDLYRIDKPAFLDHAFEYAVRRRRAAYIAEANEKYLCFHAANVIQTYRTAKYVRRREGRIPEILMEYLLHKKMDKQFKNQSK